MASEDTKPMPFEEFAAQLGSMFGGIDAGTRRVLVAKAGRIYRIDFADVSALKDIWHGYDVERVLAALRDSKGALAGIDAKQLVADIHAARKQASRGRPAK